MQLERIKKPGRESLLWLSKHQHASISLGSFTWIPFLFILGIRIQANKVRCRDSIPNCFIPPPPQCKCISLCVHVQNGLELSKQLVWWPLAESKNWGEGNWNKNIKNFLVRWKIEKKVLVLPKTTFLGGKIVLDKVFQPTLAGAVRNCTRIPALPLTGYSLSLHPCFNLRSWIWGSRTPTEGHCEAWHLQSTLGMSPLPVTRAFGFFPSVPFTRTPQML